MKIARPTPLAVAFVLIGLMGVGHLLVPFVPDVAKIPAAVVYGDVVLGVVGLIAAFGLWQLKRWGLVLSLIVLALNIVSAAPGVVSAPNVELHIVTAVYMLLSVLGIVLLALPSARIQPALRFPAATE